MKNNYLTIFLAYAGIISVGLFIHEGFHLLEADTIHRVCLDFGDTTQIAHVEAKSFKTDGEFWAVSIQSIVIGILIYIMTKHIKNGGLK